MTKLTPAFLASGGRRLLIEDRCIMTYFSILDNFKELSHLHTTIEDLVAREETNEVESLSRTYDNLPPALQGDFWSENHPYQWEHVIVPQFRGSYFVSLLSAVEIHLRAIARDAAQVAATSISADDLKGGLYQRVRAVLTKLCAFSDDPSGWERIGDFYALRNVLVHEGNFLGSAGSANRVRSLVARTPSLTVHMEHIELSREFCQQATSTCLEFLESLFGQLGLLCDRQPPISSQ
jgi:hypothetical protein